MNGTIKSKHEIQRRNKKARKTIQPKSMKVSYMFKEDLNNNSARKRYDFSKKNNNMLETFANFDKTFPKSSRRMAKKKENSNIVEPHIFPSAIKKKSTTKKERMRVLNLNNL